MPTIQIPIANGFYESDSLPISAQECGLTLCLYPRRNALIGIQT